LLDNQLTDGAWEPSARMRVPFAPVLDPPASEDLIRNYICDRGSFTTATVLRTLCAGQPSAA
jgi:hypothetical protein